MLRLFKIGGKMAQKSTVVKESIQWYQFSWSLLLHCFASSIHVIISFQTMFKVGSKATESKLHEKIYVERERERANYGNCHV
jgi:hypothetical protein